MADEKLKRGFIGIAEQLERFLKKNIVGQDDAIHSVVRHVNKFTNLMSPKGRPICNVMFLGPSGSGKTRICELLSQFFFKTEKAILKIDCAEYQQGHEVAKLTGAPPGYVGFRDSKPLFSQEFINAARTEPDHNFTIVLLDEVDKAHRTLVDLMLGIMDRGLIRTSDNVVSDFTRCFIFFTCNTGAVEIDRHLSHHIGLAPKKDDGSEVNQIAMTSLKKRLRPEFINRLDDVVVFHALTSSDIRSILELELEAVYQRIDSAFQGSLTLNISDEVKELLAAHGYDPAYNARYLHHTVERELVDPLLESMPTVLMPNTVITAARVADEICFTSRMVSGRN